ncbi:rifin [Plasmodium falciparum IGH-CR14]|uniref:Rifin n=1 Tax=Plasmodium falciparum IGH-CR14 TaxID=580059 RepID=A0A0L1IBK5_PLAFA|nr:rifin [Plasmodium falciparum IGH-CR14]
MKLHFPKILLFFFPSNILLTSYHVYNKNKIYITPHHTQTNRSLCECDIYTSIYDNDEEMKCVMQQFDDRTSQRLRKYDERLQDKRQKSKEQRDKNVQKIILNDKIDKSLVEKVEQGCLMCGCGLGGVAASIGIIGPIAVNEWTKAATVAAIAAAKEAGAAEGASQGAAAGAAKVVELVKSTFKIEELGVRTLESIINTNTYTDVTLISGAIQVEYQASSCFSLNSAAPKPICSMVFRQNFVPGNVRGPLSATENITSAVKKFVTEAKTAASQATQTSTDNVTNALITEKTEAINATYASCQIAIIASVIAIVVIALVMLIIYLILRYRRKQRMNKKQQYTKLLNQ